ncbi:histidine kinase dimerization/phosphoacceptor domain -containing protein [Leptospira kmetyi]|uniref:histidine kinase n=1 Tax=Leptospira kmetyi TaxID=408139 RepID=A0A2M9XN99_9LEPT|nr:histidine kinase dimerization/phosphoacceptor domain -containing protein [Leptospira kmetyi]AYV55311.1 response regulator [Leptospira kmetyi]EQA54019.1 PAS domain S-box protein [Leptospira kmetyi serovar Malaysia str. Bejo-Iso9]PJZ30970.1 histidine kinase [Leptospira kmetyi]PJZ40703.1 histidine kinase [Leptospira kmetyi]TGK16890.1 response regulator [Leptospira kmetyi]
MNMLQKPKILVVEDEIIVAVNLGQKLKKLGYELVGITSSGEEAIQKAEENHPDLVLMDINIEGNLDGIETAEVLRNRFHTPVIYLTAYADENTLDRAKKTQPLGYIVKPFESDQLRSSIEVALYKNEIEQRSKQTEEKLKGALDQLGAGIVTTDENGFLLFMNPAAEKLIGCKYEDHLGKPIQEILFFKNGTGDSVGNLVEEVLKSRLPRENGNLFLVAKNGSSQEVQLQSSPILGTEEKLTGTFNILRTKEQHTTAGEKDTYLKEIHHRIKNNLTIISSIFSLRSGQTNGESNDVLRESQNRLRAVALLHEILYESKDLSSISFELYVKKLTDALFEIYQVNREKVRLEMNIQEAKVKAEIGMNLALIINELITNSLKHGLANSPAGSIRIQFTRENEMLTLEVSDSGAGLPEESIRSRNPGSLGLSLVESLAKQIGGKVELLNQEGACVKLHFPAAVPI